MFKKIIRVLLVLLLVMQSVHVWSQEDPANTRPYFNELSRKIPDSSKIRVLIGIAECYFYKMRLESRMDSVAYYLDEADRINKKYTLVKLQNRINILRLRLNLILDPNYNLEGSFLAIAQKCRTDGDIENEMGICRQVANVPARDSSSLALLRKSCEAGLALARQLNDYKTEFNFLINLSDVYVYPKGDLERAEKEKLKLLGNVKKAGVANEMYLYANLSEIYLRAAKYDKSLEYGFKELELLKTVKDSSRASRAFRRLSDAYNYLGQNSEAREWAQRVCDFEVASTIPGVYKSFTGLIPMFMRIRKERQGLAFILRQIAKKKPSNLIDEKNVEGSLAQLYEGLEMFELAEKHYLIAARLVSDAKPLLIAGDIGPINYKIGSFYFKRGQYKKAVPFLEQAVNAFKSENLIPHLILSLKWLIKTDSALGNYERAFASLKLVNQFSDSIFTADRSRQIEQLTVSYKTGQKNDSILYLTQSQQIVQYRLNQTKTTRNWMIAVASLLFIIAGLLFRQGQIRKRTNIVINTKNNQLQHLVNEKEWLVKEIHHRVKNNLQTVMALLGTQSGYLKNQEAIDAINDSQHRIQSMSLIHQRLYQTHTLSVLKMNTYINELVESLSDSFNKEGLISFFTNVDPVELDIAHSIPIGLIINEAVTNSFKYAFPNQRKGSITVDLTNINKNLYCLKISDNGIGLSPDFNINQSDSMGMNLIKGLSHEIGAEFEIASLNGTTLQVKFNLDAIPQAGIQPANSINSSVV